MATTRLTPSSSSAFLRRDEVSGEAIAVRDVDTRDEDEDDDETDVTMRSCFSRSPAAGDDTAEVVRRRM